MKQISLMLSSAAQKAIPSLWNLEIQFDYQLIYPLHRSNKTIQKILLPHISEGSSSTPNLIDST